MSAQRICRTRPASSAPTPPVDSNSPTTPPAELLPQISACLRARSAPQTSYFVSLQLPCSHTAPPPSTANKPSPALRPAHRSRAHSPPLRSLRSTARFQILAPVYPPLPVPIPNIHEPAHPKLPARASAHRCLAT